MLLHPRRHPDVCSMVTKFYLAVLTPNSPFERYNIGNERNSYLIFLACLVLVQMCCNETTYTFPQNQEPAFVEAP